MSVTGELVLIGLTVALGDVLLVLDGQARFAVVCADCLVALDFLPDRSVDVIETDPPYSERVHACGVIDTARTKSVKNVTSFGFDPATDALRGAIGMEAARLTRRWTLIFCDAESVAAWSAALPIPTLRIGAWVKPDAMPQLTGDRPSAGFEAVVIAHPKGRKRWNGGGHPAVWMHPIAREDRVHTTQKPLALMLELVSLFSNEDEVILDPFFGSGTTGVAALRLGRRVIGIERDAKYAAVARERLEAESRGISLRDARQGQTSIFDVVGGT